MESKRPPHGITELSVVVSNGEQHAVNVMGVVDDLMPPCKTRGTDCMLSFTLVDASLSTNGCRFKFFKKKAEDLPQIQGRGDVLLLRNIRITRYGMETIGLSSNNTQHVVFSGQTLLVRRSSGAASPSPLEQSWAKHLRQYAGFEVLSKFEASKQAPKATPAPATITPVAASTRDKYAMIKDITAGKFYDLAGEVVKLYMSSFGYLDLYLCDYTINKDLHDYKADEIAGLSDKQRRTPQGRMTIHVELHQPHAAWALGNVHEGDQVLLKNVRVKWSKHQELEANLWQDSNYRERVLVQPLAKTDARWGDIQSRKTSYFHNVVQNPAAETKSSKKRKKRKEREAREAAQAEDSHEPKRRKVRDSGVDLGSSGDNSEQDSDEDIERSGVEGSKTKRNNDFVTASHAARATLNPNVVTSATNIPLSTIEDILSPDGRCIVSPAGDVHTTPFNNVKHHAHMRAVDFYPHRLRNFAVQSSSGTASAEWQWRFWLVLENTKEPASNDDTSSQLAHSTINVLVDGADASNLLSLEADDLKKNKKRLTELEQRLFLLWGELAEQKEKFLESNRGVEADESFSLKKYHIDTMSVNRAFECCIAEYGVPMREGDVAHSASGCADWLRCFRLFDTKIKA